jgi:CHASE3 domain sensor protein
MHIRNRLVLFLALPAAIFLWLLGWSLYGIASIKKTTTTVERKHHDE